jgi:hypothetical protein
MIVTETLDFCLQQLDVGRLAVHCGLQLCDKGVEFGILARQDGLLKGDEVAQVKMEIFVHGCAVRLLSWYLVVWWFTSAV